jgi:hypothetical protein
MVSRDRGAAANASDDTFWRTLPVVATESEHGQMARDLAHGGVWKGFGLPGRRLQPCRSEAWQFSVCQCHGGQRRVMDNVVVNGSQHKASTMRCVASGSV